jgi:hypothetical protein
MNLIDWILNLAGLFLWIDWRSGSISKRPRSILSLASAVRPAESRIRAEFGSLAVLVFLLAVRPCFYYSIGSKLDWTPQLELFAISLPWRSDLLSRMYLYSTITFLLTLGFFYSAMLLLSVINRKMPDTEVMQRFVRLQLGWIERIPWPIKVALPSLVAGLVWAAGLPLLAAIDLLPAVPESGTIWGEVLAFALAALLTWKWLLIAIFLLHLLNMYVYLGTHPVWPYISATAQKLLKPISFLSFAKVDPAPLFGIAAVLAVSELAIKPAVVQLFQKFSP